MIIRHRAAAALILATTFSLPAQASSYLFNFAGSGVSGSVELTYVVNPNTGILPETSPNPVDPIGSFIVTGATGTFKDAKINLSTTITGVVPSNPAHPEPANLLAPHSFGFFPIVNGPKNPEGVVVPGFSYDNLFYPGGSPQAASDYAPHGGIFDIYGLVFTTTNGVWINFWSNGDFGNGAIYGAGVTDGQNVLDYVLEISAVPEPASWALMVSGFGLLGAALRRRRSVRASYA